MSSAWFGGAAEAQQQDEPPPTEYVYKGVSWAVKYEGTKTDAELYLGAKTLHP